ncbi:hypothetical protein ARMGADRAFT_425228 [Armillaria gallica]|uniref:Uncharacterized protein n=1 Tax=Armillaria gallica TaxID=47427 RepID=A0A2H3ECN7_ARMGA|nr:hypothetical protein ARMGADRAFT_425228 [Armillaria gallica]
MPPTVPQPCDAVIWSQLVVDGSIRPCGVQLDDGVHMCKGELIPTRHGATPVNHFIQVQWSLLGPVGEKSMHDDLTHRHLSVLSLWVRSPSQLRKLLLSSRTSIPYVLNGQLSAAHHQLPYPAGPRFHCNNADLCY